MICPGKNGAVLKEGIGLQSDPLSVTRWQFLAQQLDADAAPSIVDIGANPLDDTPYGPLLRARLCAVHGFEPQKDAFDKLQTAKGPHETYHNLAVGDGGSHKLNVYQSSGLTSVYPLDAQTIRYLARDPRHANVLETPTIETIRLDDVTDIARVDLLKIDVQGAETMIMTNGRAKLKDAVAVITELRFFPMYNGEPSLDAQIAELASLGLLFHKPLFIKTQPIANSQSKRLRTRRMGSQALDGDAVFVRDLRDPAAISTHQIKSLALLSDAVFHSHDLTLHCLDLLVARQAVAPDLPPRYVDYLPNIWKRPQ